MSNHEKIEIPNYSSLIEATFKALIQLGGSGKNDEINLKAIELMQISDAVLALMHTNTSMTEVDYKLAWARTLLKKYGAIDNSARGVWSLTTEFSSTQSVDGKAVEKCKNIRKITSNSSNGNKSCVDEIVDVYSDADLPEEIRTWRIHLHEVLLNMNPYAFERLSQRLLRECGFSQVIVTKKSGDGGIDGKGKLKINGIFTFNIAFQCKRYQGSVGAADIRDFRGSLTTDIEKAVFITTGTFSKPAIEEASTTGKQQIDLIDGEEFIDILAELQLGVKKISDYQIDENFFHDI